MSYLQFARMGLGLQKSQNGGMGVPAAGKFDVAISPVWLGYLMGRGL